MNRFWTTAMASLWLCSSLVSTVDAATWNGGTGNWIDDSWGLDTPDGSPGDADYGTEDAVINTSGDQVTVQAGNSFDTSGTLDMGHDSALLIVEGTLNADTKDNNGGNAEITISGSGDLTVPGLAGFGIVTITNSGTLTLTGNNESGDNSGTDFVQHGGTVHFNNFRDGYYNLYGGTLKTYDSNFGWGLCTLNIYGGTWIGKDDFTFRRCGASEINIYDGTCVVSNDLLMAEEYSENWNQGTKVVRVGGGSLTVKNNLQFWADSKGGRVSDLIFAVTGSVGTVSLGGVTTGGTGTGSAVWSFQFTPDASGVSTIAITDTVPDFSELKLILNDSDAYPGTGDLGVIFEIPGTSTEATPFSNAAEGAILSFDDEGTTIYMQITYTGNDGNDIVLTNTTVSSNEPPVANDIATNAVEDVALVITVSATDADGDTLTFSEDTAPSHGSLSGFTSINATNATVTYTPDPNYNGTDSFVFLAEDDYIGDTGVVSITITPTSDPPVAGAVSVDTFEDQAVLVTLSGSDPDGDDVLTYSIASTPTNGTLTMLDREFLLYTPSSSYTGGDSFTYVVNDGSEDSAPATVSITVVDPATADDWQTDRWGLDSPDGWPGDASYPTTKATIDTPDIVALTNGSVTWTGGGKVIGNTGIAIVGTNGVMTFGIDAYLAENSTTFTTVLSDNGTINYSGTSHSLGGHLRINDNSVFSNANDSVSFRLHTVTLNGGRYKPDSSGGLNDQTTTWILNGGSLDVAGGDLNLNTATDSSCRYYFHDGLLDVTGNILADDNGDSPTHLAVIGTGMGANTADGTGLQVGGNLVLGGDQAGEMIATMVFNFDDTTGVDYWDIGGDLTLNSGNGNAILEVDLGAYDAGNGDTGIVLFDYAGSLSGTFDSITVVSEEGTLTPGTLGDLAFLEYAIDYGSGTADTVKLHAYSLRLPTGTVIAIQ